MRLRALAIVTTFALASSTSVSAQYDDSSECHDAKSNAESSASDLSRYSRRLQQCAESGDYSDDCSSEFRRVQSAYGDYESAASDVSSYCN